MKKTIGIFVLCLLLLCMAACGNNSKSNNTAFASSEEMLQHLQGMWVVDGNADEKSYYIFQDGQIYVTTDTMYLAQVKKALDSLSDEERQIVTLKVYAGLKHREIAELLGITTDACKKKYQRAADKLRESL